MTISLRKISAVFQSNLTRITRDMMMLLNFAMGPLMVFLVTLNVPYDATYEDGNGVLAQMIMFSILFSPLATIGMLIADEKEKQTLSSLIAATVTKTEFLIANTLITLSLLLLSNMAIFFIIPLHNIPLTFVLAVSIIGAIPPLCLGASLGIIAKSLKSASVILAIVPLFLFFLPQLIRDTLSDYLQYLFTHQIVMIIFYQTIELENLLILATNTLVFLVLFMVFYKKKGFES